MTTFPLTLWIGSMTTATARADSASKLCKETQGRREGSGEEEGSWRYREHVYNSHLRASKNLQRGGCIIEVDPNVLVLYFCLIQ